MNWNDMIQFNEKYIDKYRENDSFWERFNELSDLFEVMNDDLRGFERIEYITLNEFLLQNRIDKAIDKLKFYNSGEALWYVPIQDIINILKGDDK